MAATGLAPCCELLLRLLQLCATEIRHAVDLVGQNSHRLAIAGETGGLKGGADALETSAEVGVGGVGEFVEVGAGGSGGN